MPPQLLSRHCLLGLVGLTALLIGLAACRPALPRESVVVLAPDVVIHLGDDRSPPPGWAPLFNKLIPSLEWRADFFVPDSRGAWELSALVQAGRESTSELLINNRLVYPAFTTLTDTGNVTAWRAITATVPAGTLRPGPNQVLIQTGLHPPYRQVSGDVWDDFQFRDMWLVPGQ